MSVERDCVVLNQRYVSRPYIGLDYLGHRFDYTYAGTCCNYGIYGITGIHIFYTIIIFP